MPVPLPKTFAALDRYFAREPALRDRIKHIAITLYRDSPEAERDLCASAELADLSATDRRKLELIDDVYRGETSESEVTRWDLYGIK